MKGRKRKAISLKEFRIREGMFDIVVVQTTLEEFDDKI